MIFFSKATAELTSRIRPVIKRCLRDAGVDPDELDDVILVGGASRMEVILEDLRTNLGRFPNQKLNPDRVIALGAAIQAALCREDQAVGDLVLTDVAPHTLGVEIRRQISASRIEEGFFSPIIDRNTTIPTSRSDIYSTLGPEQDEIHLSIFQGEARLTKENQKIGEIKISGLKARPGQTQPGTIEVRFSYDMNGILEVDVTVLATGKIYSKVIEQRPGTLTPAEVQDALNKLIPLKIRPRDLLPNRARIERAHRLFTELIGPAREQLDQALSRFEVALDSRDEHDTQIATKILDGILKEYYLLEGEAQTNDPSNPPK